VRTVVAGKVLNHKPDSWHVVRGARSARALVKAVATPRPGQARPHVLSILDQGQLGACTGGGTTQTVRAAQHLAGVAAPALIARLWAYWLGRSFDHDTANDDGAQIGNVFAGLEMYGLCPETVWPYNDDAGPNGTFRGPPRPEAYRAAYDSIAAFRAHRLDSQGEALLDDIRALLDAGRLVVFGSAVSEAYCQNAFDPSKPLDAPTSSNIAGLHCQAIGDFSADGSSFDIVNDWNEGWGNAGWAKYKPAYLLDGNSSDFWAVDSTPLNSIVDN
jgi:hypothetical protein